jgi:hypothetical protein
MKKFDFILILITLLLAISVLFILFIPNDFNSFIDNAILSIDKSCSVDSDCVISLRDCSRCGIFPGRCVNKNWRLSCPLPVPSCNMFLGVLAPPRFKCSCINSKCTEVPKGCAELGLPADCNRPTQIPSTTTTTQKMNEIVVAKIVNITGGDFVPSADYYEGLLKLQDIKISEIYSIFLCTKNWSPIKMNSCYQFNISEVNENIESHKFSAELSGCYVGTLALANC